MEFLRFGKLISDLDRYREVKIEKTKRQAIEKIVRSLLFLGEISIYIACFGVLILFLNFALAIYINQVTGHTYGGYLIVAGLQFIFVILVRIAIVYFPKVVKRIFRAFVWRFRRNVFREED